MSDVSFMEKLLDGVEVEWKPLGEITLRTSNIKWRDATRNYRYIDLTSVGIETKKIIETSEITPDSAPSRAQKLVEKDDVIFATTRPTQMRYCLIDEEYDGEVASTGYCVLRAKKEEVLPKWILHLISSSEFKAYLEENQSGSAYPAISDAKVKEFRVPIPCPDNPKKSLEIQAEIVRILDAFYAMTAELTAELNLRKKQYNYYRDKLLSFEEGEVEWKVLGEIAEYSQTRISCTELDGSNYVGVESLLQNRAGKIDSIRTPDSGNLTQYSNGDILIGNIRPYLKKIWQADRIGGTNGDVLVVHPTDAIVNPRYLYQVLADDKFFEYNMLHAKGAKMPRGNKAKIMEYLVPIPSASNREKSLAEQERIVTILDKFDALTNSLSEGLPREIELRQKQYEYYRDLLLSFPKPDKEVA
ncbi:restriction endonuclease subunit S [Saccharophagus degradans]|uniref:restriction endonuclease subunit S n=1 Tax=Saccharophagus degradans TaxID=86304 RepID=UPI001C08A4E8|nr:restriction endonuclease subunit S [Saccharophagus degradans]MBU2984754.1 restriction endonuclease subunit S [Saccharophagus degradans]